MTVWKSVLRMEKNLLKIQHKGHFFAWHNKKIKRTQKALLILALCRQIRLSNQELQTMELSQAMEEIRLVPKDRLPELYNFIYFFRLGLETVRDDTDTEEIMRFAGYMTHDEFEGF